MKVLAIDVGGTAVKYAMIDENCILTEKGFEPTAQAKNFEDFVNLLVKIFNEQPVHPEGVTISLPGFADSVNGYCISGGSLDYNIGKPLAEVLREKIQVPVFLENDGKCAVMAEYWKGSLQGCDVGVVFALGTAVAGGIIIDGKVLKGSHFAASEFSFLCASREKWTNSASCSVGMTCSAVRMIDTICKALPEMKLTDGYDVFRVIREKHPVAMEIYNEFLDEIAQQIYNLQIILDPEVIAIGGGISAQQMLIDDIREAYLSFFHKGFWTKDNTYLPRTRIEACSFRNDANLIGAMYHYLQRVGVKHE